jgi:hypothetical protein
MAARKIGASFSGRNLSRSPVWNRIRIEPQFPNLSSRSTVIGTVDSVREQEFCLALRRVSLYRDDHSGTNQNTVLRLFSDHDAPSSMPKRLRNFAGTTIAPRFPTLADCII